MVNVKAQSKSVSWEDGLTIIDNAFQRAITMLEIQSAMTYTAKEFMDVYSTIYNFCAQKSHEDYKAKLYDYCKESLNLYLQEAVLPSLKEKYDLDFLRELYRRWLNHKLIVRWFTKQMYYIDCHYASRHKLPTIQAAGVACFRDTVYSKIKCIAKDIILDLINRERDGSTVDQTLMRNVISIFIEMSLDDSSYENDFEAYLLESTTIYYSRKASWHIIEDSCPSYLLMAEECLQLEKNRISHYLLASSEPKLLEIMQHLLLVSQANQLLGNQESGLQVMLRDNQVEDLSRMYRLYSAADNGLEVPCSIFTEYLTSIGVGLAKEAEEAIRQKKAENKGSTCSQEQAFINKVIEVHEKYMSYCKSCFMSSYIFYKGLRTAFVSFCNNKIIDETMAEILAQVCDGVLLKNGSFKGLDDDKIEKQLDKITTLLAYLDDKDLFAEFSRKKLANRLLHYKDNNMEQEQYLLAKLKQQFGNHFTSKMEGMTKDMTLAKDNQVKFENYLAKYQSSRNQGPNVNVTVLTTGCWPNQKYLNLNVPAELINCIEVYSKYYNSQTKNRKLTWIFSLGNCNMIGRFEQKSIELQVSTLQAAVLLLFNTSDNLSFQEIMTQLNILESEIELKKITFSLSCGKYKILIKEPNTKVVSTTDIFEFNSKFNDKMRRINVPVPSMEEKKKVVDVVDRDRRHTIDAAMVRIMKSRKVLHHQELVVETLQLLKQLFKPCIKLMKERIDDLINRDFLERDESNASIYRYVA